MSNYELVATIVLPLIAVFGGIYYRRVKKVLRLISEALEDDQLSVEELRGIISAILHG